MQFNKNTIIQDSVYRYIKNENIPEQHYIIDAEDDKVKITYHAFYDKSPTGDEISCFLKSLILNEEKFIEDSVKNGERHADGGIIEIFLFNVFSNQDTEIILKHDPLSPDVSNYKFAHCIITSKEKLSKDRFKKLVKKFLTRVANNNLKWIVKPKNLI